MCMEDIKIGRQSYTRKVFMTRATLTGGNAMGANKHRTRLIISTDGGGVIQVFLSQGIDGLPDAYVSTANMPTILRIEDFGNDIQNPVFINNPSANTVNIAITEVSYPYDEGPKHGISQPPEFRRQLSANGG